MIDLTNLTQEKILTLQKTLNDALKASADKTAKDESGFYQYNGELVMATLHLGWIFIGNLYSDGAICTLKNVKNCRTHDTGKGWGYVAMTGSSVCTLDSYGDAPLQFHANQLLFTQTLDPAKWC